MGPTGTNLFLVGLEQGEAPELWNLDQPEKIAAHYRSFVEAGSDIILTNTFGGTRYRLKNHVATDANVVAQVNKAAAQLALEEAAKVDRKVLVAGSIVLLVRSWRHWGRLLLKRRRLLLKNKLKLWQRPASMCCG